MSLEKKIEDCRNCHGKGFKIYTDTENLRFSQLNYEYKDGCEDCGGSGRENTVLYSPNQKYVPGTGKILNTYNNGDLIKTEPYYSPLPLIGISIGVGSGILYYLFN